MLPHSRLLHERQAARARANFSLVAPPAAPSATATHATDTAQLDLFGPGPSGAVDAPRIRPADVTSAIDSTPTIRPTPGTRTSGGATRTTTTWTTSSERVPSADGSDAAFSSGELVAAYLDCRRAKRTTAAALAFEVDQEARLLDLEARLREGRYRPAPSICFVVTRPKPREVWAAAFEDRVVHHLLHRKIAPRFERAFIADTCACIAGRGTLYAARRLDSKVRAATAHWTRRAFYLKADLANFFPSIDKRILGDLLAARIPEPWWRSLALQVLHHDPRPDADVRGARDRLALIPREKSLFGQPAHRGLPIGNLSSQFGANVYLDQLDQFVKHRLRARHYVRYVDDFILLHDDPAQLNAWLREIEAFVEQRLHVRVNPRKTILQPIERGVDFCGHLILPHRRLVRRRTLRAALHRLATMPAAGVAEAATSYLGMARQASHGARDRARIANAARRRGHAVDHRLTKVYA